MRFDRTRYSDPIDRDLETVVRKAWAIFESRTKVLYQPLLQVLTGKRGIKAVATAETASTDGTLVFLPVPLELGYDTEHDKSLCDRRDPATAQMLCPACQVIDLADGIVFHESGHINFDSFTDIPDATKRGAYTKLLRDRVASYDEALREKALARIEESVLRTGTSMGLASLVDVWLPKVLNVVEDIYVDGQTVKARVGTAGSLRAVKYHFMKDGRLLPSGKRSSWKTAPVDARAYMVPYCLGMDLDFVIPDLGDEVQELAKDSEVKSILARVSTADRPEQRFELAMDLLYVLRTYGFCPDSGSILVVKPEDMKSPDDGEDGEGDPSDSGEEGAPSVMVMDDKPKRGESSDEDDEGDESSEGDEPSDGDESGESDEGDGESDDGEPEGEHEDGEAGSSGASDDESDSPDDEGDGEGDGGEGDESEGDDTRDGSGEASEGKTEGADTDAEDGAEPVGAPTPGFTETTEDEKARAKAAAEEIDRFTGHDPSRKDAAVTEEERKVGEIAKLYERQKDYFDRVSDEVRDVRIRKPDHGDRRGDRYVPDPPTKTEVLPSLNRCRIVFTENRKVGVERSLKRGNRLDTAHLARLVTGDDRIHARRSLPKKRDWFVSIALDMSGSTGGGIDKIIATGGCAMGDLLAALGIRFAVYGHSGSGGADGSYGLDMYEVKRPEQPWDEAARQRCMALHSRQANLDGHTLEFHRRLALRQRATDKLIMYFTDGAMPAENYAEELEVLKANIVKARQQKITVVGVGVKNTDPVKHGLDCIRYDSLRDLPKLIEGLAERIA